MLAGISAPIAPVKRGPEQVQIILNHLQRSYCARMMQLRIPALFRELQRLEATCLLSTGPTLSRYQTPLLPRSAFLMIGR